MADSVVSFLLENLTQLLLRESTLLRGVEDQVKSLQDELSLINIVLKNTEGKRHDNDLVKQVVSQIRDVAYKAEDIIDTFIIAETKHRKRSKPRKVVRYFDRACALHEVANKIKRIKNVIKEIYDNRSKYIDIVESSGGGAEAEVILHRRRINVEEDQVVGFAHDADVLVKALMEGSWERNVVSIIGMGGLGKTTLARKIYNNDDVKNYFKLRRWVYVSQEYRIKESLLEILEELSPLPRVMLKAELKGRLLNGLRDLYATYSSNNDKLKGALTEDWKRFKEMNDEEFRKAWSEFLEGVQDHNDLKNSLSNFVRDFYSENGVKLKDMTEYELKSVLHESLKDKRYLLVMDDIWDIEVWNEVSTAFPINSNRSRILITTRRKEVSLHASKNNNGVPPIPPYELQLLEENKSLELFSKRVFWQGICPPALETLGRQLVKSCHGLPLAIVELGDLLAIKEKTHQIWSKYIDGNSYLINNRSSCIDILALSYNHLPRHLKPCFLYFGIYPEGFEIPVRQLIRFWIAEGFIWKTRNENMEDVAKNCLEDVAENYLEELIDRSLIQVATKRLDGGVKTCRIHNLLRRLCILESLEEKFLEVHSNVNLSPIIKSRRISIHCGNNPDISSGLCKPSNSRSMIVFKGVVEHECQVDKSYLKWFCKSNKLVRVVELNNMGICCLIPKRIEKLVLLRYLSIASGELHVIRDFMCNLLNLEMLDMRNSTMKTKCLPKGIWKLQRLRHLYLDGPTSLPKTKKKRATLPDLQFLTGIAINEDTENHFAKDRFPKLKKLGLYPSSGLKSRILSSLHRLRHLQILKIYQLDEFSSSTSIPLTLTKITLVDANLSTAIMRVLGSLTELRILKLRGSACLLNDNVLYCNVQSFQRLEVFKMENLQVDEWNMEEGAMPNLQRLVIESCESIFNLPDELWCLSALRDVEVLHPNPFLARRLQQLQTELEASTCKLHVNPPLYPNN